MPRAFAPILALTAVLSPFASRAAEPPQERLGDLLAAPSRPEPDKCPRLRQVGAAVFDKDCNDYWGAGQERKARKLDELIRSSLPESDRCRLARAQGLTIQDGACAEFWKKEAAREKKLDELIDAPAPSSEERPTNASPPEKAPAPMDQGPAEPPPAAKTAR